MANNWMEALSAQFKQAYTQYPEKRLMLLFDIDGTILDMRHVVLAVLQAYDRTHSTDFFVRLQLSNIRVHENQVDKLLEELNVPLGERDGIMSWYLEQQWTSEAIREIHRPFFGVLDVIRWFQLQPNTEVGLVTGRPERLRDDTLRSLNQLAKPYRVKFTSDLLFMNPGEWEENVADLKAAGLQHFRKAGYHVFAFIDNEPSNLKTLAKSDPGGELLLLHANTIFESKRTRVPPGTVRGKDYYLEELIPDEKALPAHVQLAWHGVNDEANLRQFLASDVRWAEVDARLDPACWDVILRHDSFANTPLAADEQWQTLDKTMDKIKAADRAIKIDLKAGGMLLDRVFALLSENGFSDKDIWFNAGIEQLMERGFKRLAASYPDAIIQCPIDFLAPLIEAVPKQAHDTLKMLTAWGINRFSISWERQNLRELFDQMDRWGYQVNIYNVPDLETFLQAVLLLPRSVTSDFNFPQWHYYGHGSGVGGTQLTYRQTKKGHRKRR